MSDGSDKQQGAPDNAGVREDLRSAGDEGRRSAQSTPPIADDAEHGQTQSPAPAADVGVPPDEEMGREDE